MLIVGTIALLLAAFAGYRLAGAALRPVESMRREAAAISSETSGRRLSVPEARDEVRRLGETLNEMLERLDEGLLRERRFVADAGHELRTPLALLRTELELALRGERSHEELKDALRSATEEVERLIRLSEGLLALERSGWAELRLEELDARELLDGVARRFASRAAAAGRTMRSTAAARSAAIATGSSRRSAASSTTRSRTARGRSGSKPSRAATRSSSASATKAPASRTTSCRGRSSASAVRTRRGRRAAPASGSRSSTP